MFTITNKIKISYLFNNLNNIKLKTVSYISTFIITILFSVNVLVAQEYKVPVTNTKDGKIILENFMGNLHIEGYDGKEIVFTKTSFGGDKNFSISQHAKGANDNSGIGLRIEKNGSQVTATCVLTGIQTNGYKLKVPNNFSIKVTSDCERSKDISISDMRNEVEVNNCQSIKLSNITGSLILSATSGNIVLENCALAKDATISIAVTSGNIRANLSSVDTKEPILVNSISGNVSLTLPANTNPNFTLKSVSGVIKSDFDFPDESKKTNQVLGPKIDYKANSNAVTIMITTVSGNITLRKDK